MRWGFWANWAPGPNYPGPNCLEPHWVALYVTTHATELNATHTTEPNSVGPTNLKDDSLVLVHSFVGSTHELHSWWRWIVDTARLNPLSTTNFHQQVYSLFFVTVPSLSLVGCIWYCVLYVGSRCMKTTKVEFVLLSWTLYGAINLGAAAVWVQELNYSIEACNYRFFFHWYPPKNSKYKKNLG